jgi:NADPH:quinone reductase
VKATVVRDDGSLGWEEVPDPVPGPGEICLEIQATAVNRADLLQRRGLYPPPPGAPPYMGLEASGTVGEGGAAGASDPSGWAPGMRACCLLAGGGYAEKVAVHQDLLLPVPEGIALEEAASLPEAFATAYLNLFVEAGLKQGETVLIHAGASGVGAAAIQLAHDRGARVLASVGSPAKAAWVSALGADRAILYKEEDLTAIFAQEHPDVVLDCLGGEDLARHLPLLRTGGRWVVIGLMKGRSASLDLRSLLSSRLRLIGSTLRSRSVAGKSAVLRGLEREVWPRMAAGAIRPSVYKILPIAQAAEGHAILERNENLGKVVLRIRE